ncbi:MAG: alanine racemase [Thermodesulfobacteriota bacterium]|nr:alanine racemase [Thermodesulfobacteriota bacterium]
MYAHRPTHVEIDLVALRHNYQLIRQHLTDSCEILAVVKADAYGHGAVEIARVLQRLGTDMFGVAIAEEGLELRAAGITLPILMLGGPWSGQEDVLIANDLQVCVFDVEHVRRLEAAARDLDRICHCHLKVDSGMGRLGVLPADLSEILQLLRQCPHLVLDGVMSHFAVADVPQHPYTRQQLELFLRCVKQVRAAGFSPRYIHAANSAATLDATLDADIVGCNLVRPGIALYGGQPLCEQTLPLQPVMSFCSEIAHLKHLPVGSGVSYGLHFVTKRPTIIAAIPVGYADGYNRLLSNIGTVLVRGQRVPVVGSVCMDWTLLDVTDVAGVVAGDKVTLLGCDGGECVLAEQWADQIGTISYEVFCQISKRVPRYYRGGEEDA